MNLLGVRSSIKQHINEPMHKERVMNILLLCYMKALDCATYRGVHFFVFHSLISLFILVH